VRRVPQSTMTFFDQARFTQAWLADDQRQLAVLAQNCGNIEKAAISPSRLHTLG
jgi:hypothetical protein